MINLSINRILFGVYSIILVVVLLFVSDEFTVQWAHLLFLGQLVFAFNISRDYETKWAFFFSPSFLLVLYVDLNAFLGAYSLRENLLIEVYQFRSVSYGLIKGINIPYAYVALCSMVAMLVLPTFFIPQKNKITNQNSPIATIIVCFLLICFFSIVKIDLSIIGGDGDFSTIPKSITSIILFYELSKTKYRYRYIAYTLILILFMMTNFDSKREAVFMIIPIILLENMFGNLSTFNFTLKKIILSILALLALIYSLLIMTILRGFGQYDISNPIDAYKYVGNLLNDYNIAGLLFTISEAPTTTYVSIKAMSLVHNDFDLMTYGSTYFKLFFVPIPRSLFSEKPLSMTSIFTKIEAPGMYGVGGSLPINVYAESFWNFHFGGVIVILFMVLALNFMYSKMIATILNHRFSLLMGGIVFGYTYLIGFYRGFGFDLYSVNIIVGLFFSIIVSWSINLILNFTPMFKK